MIITFIIQSISVNAQLIGVVRNENDKPIPYSNVLLLHPQDSSLIKGTVANQSGLYHIENIEQGKYIIKASSIGYHPTYSGPVTLNTDVANKKEYTLILRENVQELKELVIEEVKPLYEQKIDRLVVNVENSITSSGNTTLEILQKSPGVQVNRQNNSLILNGKSGVAVMINNKIIRLPTEAIVQMLDGMSAANIEKIELINQPPSKYEAKGIGGIIHIVMKRHTDIGTKGNLGITLGYNWAEIIGANLNINHRSKKISAFLNYSIMYDYNRHNLKNHSAIAKEDFIATVNSQNIRKPFLTVQNLNTGFGYNISKHTSVEALLTFYQRNWTMQSVIESKNVATPDSTVFTKMDRDMHDIWTSIGLNTGVNHEFNDFNKLSIDFDYLYYINDNYNLFKNEIIYEQYDELYDEQIEIDKNTPIDFKVIKLDYVYSPSNQFKIESGLKTTISTFDNDVVVKRYLNNQWRRDSEFTNFSDFSEWIAAGYASAKYHLNNKTEINGGLRYEYTETKINTPEQEGIVDRGYGNLFPNLLIKRKINKNTDLQVGYQRRMTRPTYNDLAPFATFFNPNLFITGNTSLLPAILDGFKIDCRIKEFIFSLNFSYTKNTISNFQPEVDKKNNIQIMRTQNLDYSRDYSITIALPVDSFEWWEVQSNFLTTYIQYKTSYLERNVEQDNFGLQINIVNNFNLPEDFTIELSGNYQSGVYWGLMEFEPMLAVNAGIQKQLNNNWGKIRLSVDDIFNTNNWKWEFNLPDQDVISGGRYLWNRRSIKLTYTKSFGNKKLKKINIKSGSDEEKRRVRE